MKKGKTHLNEILPMHEQLTESIQGRKSGPRVHVQYRLERHSYRIRAGNTTSESYQDMCAMGFRKVFQMDTGYTS